MKEVSRYAIAYCLWFVDIGLSVWLFFISRTALLALLAVLNKPDDYWYAKRAILVDRVFTLLFGIGLLAFFVITEEYFRAGALKEGLVKRFARLTGPLMLSIFIVDFILFWLQGSYSADWFRWMILSAELVIGLLLVMYVKKKGTNEIL